MKETRTIHQIEPYTRKYPVVIVDNKRFGYCEVQCIATNLKGVSKAYYVPFQEMIGSTRMGTYGYVTIYCYPHHKVEPTYVYNYDFTEMSKSDLEGLFGKSYTCMVENQFTDNLWSEGYV